MLPSSVRFPSLALACLATAATLGAALPDSPQRVQPLAVGKPVPAVVVRSADDQEIKLAEMLAGRKSVVIFYRGGWCPYCNLHLAALGELEPQLQAAGWQILALSPDEPAALAPTAAKNKTAYRLLSDRAMQAAAAFGVAFRVDAATVAQYQGFGVTLAPVPGEPAARWLPVPAVFLVDRAGRVRFVHADADYKARLSSPDLLAAAAAVD